MRPRYLRPALTMPQIYLYRAPIDFRKQAHGLAALVLYQSPPQQDQVSDVGGQRLCALLQGAGRGEIQVAIVCR